MSIRRKALSWLGVPVAALAVVACGSDSSGGGGGDTIKIGASLSQTGALGQFGPLIGAGYKQAVDEVNAAGGVNVGDERRKVELVITDNQSDPNRAAQQVRSLVTQEGVTAVLGAASPAINIPSASAAEAKRTPFVTSFTPVTPWRAATDSGWRYAWDFFLDPLDAVQVELKTADLVKTNKRIALFTANEADGEAWGAIVNKLAPGAGYEVATHATVPVGTSNFRSLVQQASKARADIVIAMMAPPDGIALWKQMKALGYRPKIAFCEKCGNAGAFPKALGPIADGASAVGLWTSSQELPGTDEVKATLGKQYPNDPDLSVAIAAKTAAQVVLDAIVSAGSTEPDKINAAIGKTDKTYTFGHIKFGPGNVAQTPAFMQQWQGESAAQVYPPVSGAEFQFPAVGLQ
jgi:branched-chain amino acid transport system substrate-binding protein